MRIQEIKLYQYDELSDDAKAKARDWWREASAGDDFWHECAIEDFADCVAKPLGFSLDRPRGHRSGYAVYFSGFWSQGDGACFESSWRARDCNAATLIADRPEVSADGTPQKSNAELCRIARGLQDLAARYPDAWAGTRQRGRYYDMAVEFDTGGDGEGTDADVLEWESAAEEFTQLTRDLADWLYRTLESEYEYTQSDEVVAETIIANEYEFTEDGECA